MTELANIEGKDLSNWDEFEREIAELRAKYSNLLFRGVNDSEAQLTTTLERAVLESMSFDDFYRLVYRIKPAVETLTKAKWGVPEYGLELSATFRDRELFSKHHFPTRGLYAYMVYLRHHGFPSPLLDWTKSPYVAAFFAFRDVPITKPKKRSVYVYCEIPNTIKGGAVGAPSMRAIGPYVSSHRRHFFQQSNYTMCCAFDENVGWQFHPHGPVFGGRMEQDYLWKFNLGSSDRLKVLNKLQDYNLNAFSLFDSEETLLETLWLSEHLLKSHG